METRAQHSQETAVEYSSIYSGGGLCWPLTLIENRLVLKTSGDLSSPHISTYQEKETDRTAACAFFLLVQKAYFFH